MDAAADNQHETLLISQNQRNGSVHSSFLCGKGGKDLSKKEEKKENIRRQIINAAQIYSNELAGKVFMYVYGKEYFEVMFLTDRFLHLTGVETALSAQDFYKKAKKGILEVNQFFFTESHPMGVVKKKLPCLSRLPELTKSMICIVKKMNTVSITYTIGLTNLEFTLGLTENTDKTGKKINDYYVPRSLRVKDHAIDISEDGDIVDFILMKDASAGRYDRILFADPNKKLPDEIKCFTKNI